MAIPKRIAAVSMAAPELERVKQLLEQVRNKLPRAWTWAAEADADVLLIDVDSVYGHMDWLRAQSTGRRIISLSSRAGSEHDVTLARPISADGLVRALTAIEDSVASSPEGAAAVAPAPAPARAEAVTPPAPPASAAAPAASEMRSAPAAPASAVTRSAVAAAPTAAPESAAASAPAAPMPPAELVLPDFCTSEMLPAPARLVRGDAPAVTVDAASDCYYGPRELKPLLPYTQGPISREEWTPVSGTVMEGLRASGSAQPLARLLWLFALANSNAQLLPGLDLNARFKLGKWPQIEREFPRHFRIATIMMKGPATLTEIADQSGAALPDVIDFINAYSVTGFVEMEGATAAAPEAVSSGGLLSRLRARVRRS